MTEPSNLSQLRDMAVIAGMIFVAELGDKTQLAAFTAATSGQLGKLQVWASATLGLALSTGVAVLLAHLIGPFLSQFPVQRIAGLMFVALGAWMIVKG